MEYVLFQILVWWVLISDWPSLLADISFYRSQRSSGSVPEYFFWQNIMEPSMSHPNKNFLLLTFKMSLSVEEMTSTIYVCTWIGAADSCSNVHLPIRQKSNHSTIFIIFSDNCVPKIYKSKLRFQIRLVPTNSIKASFSSLVLRHNKLDCLLIKIFLS
jgi:hypothetical protein